MFITELQSPMEQLFQFLLLRLIELLFCPSGSFGFFICQSSCLFRLFSCLFGFLFGLSSSSLSLLFRLLFLAASASAMAFNRARSAASAAALASASALSLASLTSISLRLTKKTKHDGCSLIRSNLVAQLSLYLTDILTSILIPALLPGKI